MRFIELNVPAKVSIQAIADLLTDAVEGASGYWIRGPVEFTNADLAAKVRRDTGKPAYCSAAYWEGGGGLRGRDIEGEPFTVTLKRAERWLTRTAPTWAAQNVRADLARGTADGETADCLFQGAAWGGVVYG